MPLKSLITPQTITSTLLVLAAFGLSLFFGGVRDLEYAPAIIALLLLACIGIIPAFKQGLRLPAAPAAIILFAFWLYVTLSLSWSTVPFVSLVTYLIITALPLSFFTVLLSPQRDRLAPLLAGSLWAAICVLSLWAVIQYVFLQDAFGDRAHHPLPNPNNLAALLNLGLIPALAFLIGTKDRDRTYLALLIVSAVLFAGLVATESRGGLLSALIAAAVLAIILRKEPPVLWQRLLGIAITAAIIFNMVSFFGGYDLAPRLAALAAPGTDEPTVARLAIWDGALKMLQDHLWRGTGLGSFYLYYPSYRLPGADNSIGHWAHMDPLQFGTEMGIIAPLLLYALIAAIAVRSIRALKALPVGAPERTAIAATASAFLALMLHSHVTFNLYIMPILIVCGIGLAYWYSATTKALGDEQTAFRPVTLEAWQKPFMAGITLAIAGLIGIMAASSAAGQYHLLRAQSLLAQGMTDQFTTAIENAERWAPRSFIDPEMQLAGFYIDLLGKDTVHLFTPEEQQSLYLQSKDLLDIAQSQNPPWAEIDYKRGKLYSVINEGFEPEARTMAISALQTAIEKDPMHFTARQDLASLYIRRGHVDKAHNVLEDGLAYPHSPAVETAYQTVMVQIEPLLKLKQDYETEKKSAP
ncbi:MAG: O-antigen ligase family protein [Rhodospirillales bacterium]|nr:O-antigen ligase family protein [Rhodospirillales bacterium]MCB9996392.1 O-antigen ligase family protein [Rhodospirillales bacterium]